MSRPASRSIESNWLDNPIAYVVCAVLGVVILTTLMHLARGVGRLHARMAKVLLVTGSPGGSTASETLQPCVLNSRGDSAISRCVSGAAGTSCS